MFDWADPIFDGIAAVMAWFYSLLPDYTFAIAMLTLAIMLLFTPLTLRGARSMTKMQALQPEMAQLRKKHAGDRQKINEEMMRLYQSHGVSPLGGCLPNLVQIPIFIVLYRVILNLRVTPDSPHPDFPRNLNKDSQLYTDLVDAVGPSGFGEMRSLGMDLAQSAREVVQADFVEGLPYLALIAVTFLLAWLQQRQMAARRGTSAMPNRQMEIMMKYLPFMLPVFSFFVPAALVPYFIVSTMYRMLQQAFIHARMKPPTSLVGADADDDAVEAETVPEPAPQRQVPNQRSRKALDAEAERRAERERRRAERRDGSQSTSGERAPAPPASSVPSASPASPTVRRTRSSEERVVDARKRARRSAGASNRDQGRNQTRERGRRRAEPEPESKPIQSRRTSGDGRTRNRRKR